MKVLILQNQKQAVKKVFEIIIKELKKKPKLNLGLATGKTMVPLYKLLSKNTTLRNVKTFNLDEYISKENLMRKFMQKHLFKKSKIKEENIYFPNKKNPREYDTLIKKLKGIDVQILGIGTNGHIAFNEPGSSFKSKTRKIKLSSTTIRDNSLSFHSKKEIPKYALTMGLSTIMKSKKIILLATGKSKAEAIAKTIQSKSSIKVPASILQKHKNTTIILDKDAASKMKRSK